MSQKTASTISISLTCKRAAHALDFYTKAFGAVELFHIATPDGGVGHAEFMLGNTHMFMSDESAEWHAYAMPEGGRASCLFTFNVDNADEAFAKAVAAGATPLCRPQDQFFGERTSVVCDPFGYRWCLRQHIEDVSPEEMMKRAQALMSGAQS